MAGRASGEGAGSTTTIDSSTRCAIPCGAASHPTVASIQSVTLIQMPRPTCGIGPIGGAWRVESIASIYSSISIL